MELTLDDHRVDHAADVVDRDVGEKLDNAGARIDLDLGDMRAARIGEVHRIVERLFLEARLEDLRADS